MKKRYLLVGLLVLALAISMVAVSCGGSSIADYPTTGPVKVGHILDLTGFEAGIGLAMKPGLVWAFTDAMVGDRPVEVVEADAESTTAGAVEAAKYLVESEGVIAIIGPTQIGQKEAVAAYCADMGVPLIFYNPVPAYLVEGNDWVIGSGGTINEPMTVIADYIYKDLGYDQINFIGGDDTGSHAFSDPFIEHYQALGGEVVLRQDAPYGQDYSVYLANLEDADALVTWYGGDAGLPMLRQYIELGIDEKMDFVAMYHGGMTDPYYMIQLGQEDADLAKEHIGTRTVMAWNPDYESDPVNKAYVESIAPSLQWGPPADDGTACSAQGALYFLAAANSVEGDLTREGLRDALLSLEGFVGPEGPQYFADGSHAATKPMYIVEVVHTEDVGMIPIFGYEWVKTYDDVPPEGLSVD